MVQNRAARLLGCLYGKRKSTRASPVTVENFHGLAAVSVRVWKRFESERKEKPEESRADILPWTIFPAAS